MEPRKDAFSLLALSLNALGMCEDDPARADMLFREAPPRAAAHPRALPQTRLLPSGARRGRRAHAAPRRPP